MSSIASSSVPRFPEKQLKAIRKRNRVPLSCHSCRTRKLKCDRGHPCSNCSKREGAGAASCSYATPAARKKNSQNKGALSADDMQNRIDQLEGLVLSLMHGRDNVNVSSSVGAAAAVKAAAASSSTDSGSSAVPIDVDRDDNEGIRDENDDSDVDDGLANSLGVLKVDVDRSKSMYIGQEHWHTLLADIAEVKNYYLAHKKELEDNFENIMVCNSTTALSGPTFLCGATPATEVELRAELPAKSSVLKLCGRYFNSMDNAVNIIHAPTFHQQLRNHWQDPSKSPIMWLGLLYSVLCLAMLSYHKVDDEPPEWKGRSLDLAAEYRMRTVQCLVKGDYTSSLEYTVETMLLYVFGEYSSRWDTDVSLWLISSLVTRVAYRMGYHRDAKWFSSITPFQAEMRRRTWALVRISDVMFSHRVGLPNMIYDHDCDTEVPHNILDEEFGPDTTIVPPSRPIAEPTPISYMIAKVRLCLELGRILQATGRIRNTAHYDEILQFDARLRGIRAELPPHLKMYPLESSGDAPALLIARFNIDILYQKIVCLLHRKYVDRSRDNPRYAHSRRSAIEASLETLGHLITLHRESQPHGRLRSISWFVKSIATKDFLLPAVMIVVDLHADVVLERPAGQRPDSPTSFWTRKQRADMITRLEQTRDIWKGLAEGSMEVMKASTILDIMLQKIKAAQAPANDSISPPVAVKTEGLFSFAHGQEGMQPELPAAMKLTMQSGGVSTAAAFGASQIPGGSTYPPPDHGLDADFASDATGLNGFGLPFSSMFDNLGSGGDMDVSTNFDWNTLENYTQMANWGTEQPFHFFLSDHEQAQHPSSGRAPYSFNSLGAI